MNFLYRLARLRVFYLLLVLLSTQLAAHAQTNEGLVPDSVELRVLRQFYYATGGPGWTYNTGWPTTPADWQAANLTEAANWQGLIVVGEDVKEINLTYNQLTGSLPVGLGQLRELQTLNLSSNQLMGSIPAGLGQLSALQTLSLIDNQLTGPIPIELGQLSTLWYLDLYDNQLTGSIPTELGQLSELRTLSLYNNQLTGSLPVGLGQLRELQTLNLSSNQLMGSIPAGLGQLSALRILSLADNQLTGPIPIELGQLSALWYLDLANNQLTGSVPVELGELNMLNVLDLYSNQLTGFIPIKLITNRNLQNLNLSNNQLSGFIPVEPGKGHYASLYVSSNQYDFNNLEPQFTGPNVNPYQYYFSYAPQSPPPGTDTTTYTPGEPLTLNRSLGGKHTHYQWQRQQSDSTWQNLTGQIDSVYQLSTADALAEGLYRTQATNDWVTGLTLTSKPIYARAQAGCQPPKLTVTPAATSVQAGDAVNLRAYADPATATVQWRDAAGTVLGSSSTQLVTPAQSTTYTVTATTGPDCTTTATVAVTVVPAPPLRNPPVAGTCAPTITTPRPPSRPADADDHVNYVRTFVPRVAITDATIVSMAASKDSVQIKTEYLDGLGRPVQTVLRAESPLGNDVVQPVAYDGLGRQPRQYLPYVAAPTPTAAGAYRPNALYEQDDFYRPNTIAGPGLLTEGIARTGVAYSEQEFEASPLNRVRRQAAPGESWALNSGHAVGREERPNTAADAVPRFEAGYDPKPNQLTYQADYAAGDLWLTQTTDEQGRLTQEFQDKQGQVVAKKVEQAAGQWLTTVYVFDDFSRLRAVLPPKAIRLLATGGQRINPAVDSLLFRYRYDARGRVAAKQVPGQAGETQLVYDQLDRPVLSQDPQQRQRKQWSWTKYDVLGRVVLTGLVTRSSGTRTQTGLQAEADAWTTPGKPQYAAANQVYEQRSSASNYSMRITSNQSYPPMSKHGFSAGPILTATYYDDYNFDNVGGPDAQFDAQYAAQFPTGPVPAADLRVTGLATRTQTRVLGVAAGSVGEWLTTTSFYDERARPVQVVATNARGGQDVVTTQLDFAGKVLSSYSVHQGPNHEALPIKETFAYDHAGRLLEARQQLPGEQVAVVIAENRYNELGQVQQKTLAPSDKALTQRLDYGYNIRGWLTGLNEAFVGGSPTDGRALWGMKLSYDCGFAVSQYNGNIAGQQWRSKSDGVARAYGYLYDRANRLTGADYVAQQAGGGAWSAEQQRYGMNQVRYDENGNILVLERRGLLALATRALPAQFGPTDNLAYKYQGNRLVAVEDAVSGNALPQPADAAGALTSLAGDFQEKSRYAGVGGAAEYGYDANGSITSDKNKGITAIRYNHLNLPERIDFSAQDYIEFRYAASGQKVAKLVYQAGKPVVQTDYLGAYQYEGDSLRFFAHAEGRVLLSASLVSGQARYEREFTLKDHLGNLRLAYRKATPATYTASMEPARARTEQAQFDSASIASTRFATDKARTGGQVARLNAATGQPLGPLKLLAVHKGDMVRVLAPGLYQQAVSNPRYGFSLLGFVATLLQQPATGPAPVGPDGRTRPRALPFLGLGLGLVPALQTTGRVPKGYVRVLVYNQDSVLVDSQTQQLSAAALNSYEELRVNVVAPSDGYLTVYVGNESDTDVYFDDVEVRHNPAILVQENHYDPWGLNLVGLSRLPKLQNKYSWNGKERQDEFGLNWQDHGWRFYDPQLGRWVVTDPDGEEGDQESWTSYQFGLDNAVRYNDLDGRMAGGPGGGSVAGLLYNTVVGTGVSLVNASVMTMPGVDAVTNLVAGGSFRASLGENGEVSYGIRPAATTLRGMAANAGSDVLDLGLAALTVFSAGEAAPVAGSLRMGAGMLFEQGAAKVGANAAAQSGKQALSSATSSVSPRVQKIADQLKDFKKNGQLTLNKNSRLTPGNSREANISIRAGGDQLNIRLETHPLTPKGPPVRHINVEPTTPSGKPKTDHLPNKGHLTL